MAPEQVSGRPSDPRSDLFSLGVILYEMLSGRAPFRRDTAIETLHAILKEQAEEIPTAEAGLPEGLSRLVQHLMEKQQSNRFQSASDLLYDLDGVEGRSSSGAAATIAEPRSNRWLLVGGIGVAAVVLAVVFVMWPADEGGPGAPPKTGASQEVPITVAVLPFEERGGPSELSYLALGLPDEIVTELSYAKGLAVRSFTQSSRFTAPVMELAEVGEALGANHLVVGQYGLEGDSIRVSVEAIDLDTNQVVWRDSWGAAGEDLLALRDAMRQKISAGLLVALGRDGQSVDQATSGPGSAEAYDLYLKASTGQYEPAANREAIELLERSLELDPGFAQAWLVLAGRYHYDALLAEGADPSGFQLSYDYTVKALELDPNLFGARVSKLTRDTERGNLVEAFQGAVDLVRGRPDSGRARVTMAYVLRYGGAIDESARECEEARRLDPEGRYRSSCQWTYAHVGDYEKALEHIDLFAGTASTLRKSLRADMLMRGGDRVAALAEIVDASDELAAMDIQRACLLEEEPADLATWIAEREESYAAWGDPETLYWYAALMADCGFPEVSLRFLELSIDRTYCVAAALDNDPLWETIRTDPRFLVQRQRSRECHERFMVERAG